jgi:HEAT repeat protein
MALERDKGNLPALVDGMSDKDSGIRYWAVVGLHLLDANAKPATEILEKALQDPEDEVKIMAAWTLVKLGKVEAGQGCLLALLNNGTTAERKLYNVLDWMEEDALPVVQKYLDTKPKKVHDILAKIAKDHGLNRQ